MADRPQDPVSDLLDAALEVHRIHEPDADGNCTHPDCASCRTDDEPATCLAYLTAETVLNLWNAQDYLVVASSHGKTEASATGLGDPNRSPRKALDSTAGPMSVDQAADHEPAPVSALPGGHPSWCAGPPYCAVGQGLSHASTPEQVEDVVLMLLAMDGDGPMISITDQASSIVLPAGTADEIGHAIHDLSQRAAA